MITNASKIILLCDKIPVMFFPSINAALVRPLPTRGLTAIHMLPFRVIYLEYIVQLLFVIRMFVIHSFKYFVYFLIRFNFICKYLTFKVIDFMKELCNVRILAWSFVDCSQICRRIVYICSEHAPRSIQYACVLQPQAKNTCIFQGLNQSLMLFYNDFKTFYI